LRIGRPGHGAEIGFVFDQPTADTPDATATDHAVAEKMNACWAKFAKTGDPNGESLSAWPAYALAKDQLLDFAADGKARAVADARKERLDLVQGRALGVSP
jgi:para-nitrobenzyl esterase